ncbi:hypothetical protein CWN47_18225 [Klebsiella variicola]|uniref:Uncharacterized protein n=1 Tax=Klebsiella variicola TaxID=244366 RepID=A0A2N5A7T1_KLEVA|nr:hypothetical protein CWN47_18225 [Klebsiella variicola]PLP39667.1 hypothetical protein CWM98_29320 [Klebsiella variicola]
MACEMAFFLRKISSKGYPARPSWTILVSVWHVCVVVRFFWLKGVKKWRQESPALAGLRLWRPC